MKKQVKTASAFLMLILGLVILAMTTCRGSHNKPQQVANDTLGVMVMQIQKCSRLYTAEAQVRKIVTQDDQMRLQGSIFSHKFDVHVPGSERKVAIPIDATVKAYIDFGSFSKENVVRHGDRIEIILPDPQMVMTSSRIDHEHMKEHVSLARSNYSDKELAQLEQQGRDAIIKDIPQLGLIETARLSAANILIPMLKDMGFAEQHVTVTFRKDFNVDTPQLKVVSSDVEQQ